MVTGILKSSRTTFRSYESDSTHDEQSQVRHLWRSWRPLGHMMISSEEGNGEPRASPMLRLLSVQLEDNKWGCAHRWLQRRTWNLRAFLAFSFVFTDSWAFINHRPKSFCNSRRQQRLNRSEIIWGNILFQTHLHTN